MRYLSPFLHSSALLFGLCPLFDVAGAEAPSAGARLRHRHVTVHFFRSSGTSPTTRLTARIAAVGLDGVRAHVWGYWKKVNFKEVTLVKKGTSFLNSTSRPYQAILDHAGEGRPRNELQLAFDESEYHRTFTFPPGRWSRSDPGRPRSPGRRLANHRGRQGLVRGAPAGPWST